MAYLAIETETKTAEVYVDADAWHIERRVNSPEVWIVIGPEPGEFASLQELLSAPRLPDLVKWAARGLAGIPA